jgi:BMFP domain-containing protein YqiC
LKSLGLPTAQEVAELQERVAALEAALAATAPKAAPRKRAATKTVKTRK